LTPEWYCNPAFLKNTNSFKLGTSQDGELLGDVTLPPWAKKSPEIFVEVMRNALESDLCSEMLPDWIDLIFGRKQQGPEAIKAHNVFFYLTYYGSVDVASIEDEGLREATELQIAHFGQCPMQLFVRPHVRRVQKTLNFRKLSFYQLLSANAHGAKHPSDGIHRPYTTKLDGSMRLFGEPLYLPFFTAPQSHWVHLDAPPPGPHANLIAVRLAGVDRCVAIDSAGIYHSFRWAWKPDETVDEQSSEPGPIDRGNFIAQRELPRFRTVPRLIYSQSTTDDRAPAVAISKTLFASRSVLLVLSDGDGCGGLAMQLIDPSKGTVKAEAMVPSAHSSRVTCIAMDPIGTAAGHGGVGGELAIVGSADGGTTLWRFMSSHYLPLRPRIRMRGHCGSRVQAVALSSAIHICASVSREKCCIFSIGNGAMIHSWPPPDVVLPMITEGSRRKTIFCDTPALGLSVQGFVITVCKTFIESDDGMSSRNVITLHLFSLEGVSLGSKALEAWRGIPHKIACTPDGTAITVCHGRGVTIHRLSAITPLEYIDEWHTTESDELDETTPAAWDVDFGPSLMRPIVAAAACSSGVLRLHALPGISAWSERHRKSSIGIGMSFSKPVGRLRDVVGKLVGVSKDVGKEVSSEVRERGVGGFLAGTLFRKNAK
jgi:Beige/BEACH domain